MKKIFIAAAFIFLISASAASAHQPRIVSGTDPVEVKNPQISQAFYGELFGAPQVFEFTTTGPMELYINLLVPKNTNPDGRYLAQVTFNNNVIGELKGGSAAWTEFFEEFGRDWYLQGPELKMELQKSGTYRAVVSGDKENFGKYVFVIGEKESFPPGEIINAAIAIPFLKANFFHSSVWGFFTTYFGIGVLAAAIIILALAVFLARLLVKMKNRKAAIAIAVALAILAALFSLRFFSGEDNWICQNGEWVKHGRPSAPTPDKYCGRDYTDGENISWDEMRDIISYCQTKKISQAHSLGVSVWLKNGAKLNSTEPAIDDIINLAVLAQEKCGKIQMMTE